MTKTYEELIGGVGAAVSYRPERHLVREILADHAATIVIEAGNGDNQEFRLYDISMNGASFITRANGVPWSVDSDPTVRIRVGDEEVYHGQARVVRTEDDGGALRIGLHLLDRFLDLPRIRNTYQERALDADLRQGADVWRSKVPPAYREVIEEASHFLNFYRQTLDRHERRYAQTSDTLPEAVNALAHRALGQLRAPWHAICEKAAVATLPCFDDSFLFRACKAYTETMLTPLLIDCPLVDRCYNKPLGYPGDYQAMLQIYRNEPEGETAFARAFHKIACELPLAAGVRARKDVIKDLHAQEHQRVLSAQGGGCDFRVTSVGSGVAREICELIRHDHAWPGRIYWTLIDQEQQVLSLAHQEICQALAYENARASLQCLYTSFTQFLANPASLILEEPQDFIYAVGLFDYLPDRSAKRLVRILYDKLAPGGLLAVTNAVWPNTHYWMVEFISDWTLIYRTRDNMLSLADKVPDARHVDVIEEPAGAYYFTLIRKP